MAAIWIALALLAAAPARADAAPIPVSMRVICPEDDLERHFRGLVSAELAALPGVALVPFNEGRYQLYFSVVRIREKSTDDVLSYAVGWVVGLADPDSSSYHLSSFAVATFPSGELDRWIERKVQQIDAEYLAAARAEPSGAVPASPASPGAGAGGGEGGS